VYFAVLTCFCDLFALHLDRRRYWKHSW